MKIDWDHGNEWRLVQISQDHQRIVKIDDDQHGLAWIDKDQRWLVKKGKDQWWSVLTDNFIHTHKEFRRFRMELGDPSMDWSP